MTGRAPAGSSRAPRNAAAAVVVVVLLLVAVLVGLLQSGRPDAGAPATTVSASSPRATTTRPSTGPTRSTGAQDPRSGLRVVALAELPREARATVALIDAGGPFPYAKDGVTFGNNERLLPAHPRGWYREYTVRTPGEQDRGARRIVTGDDDRLVFYTADHYGSFVQVSR